MVMVAGVLDGSLVTASISGQGSPKVAQAKSDAPSLHKPGLPFTQASLINAPFWVFIAGMSIPVVPMFACMLYASTVTVAVGT